MAPKNTVIRGWRIAIIAAMKNVLSPNSDTIITDTAAINPWIKPKLPKFLNLWKKAPGFLKSPPTYKIKDLHFLMIKNSMDGRDDFRTEILGRWK